MTTIKTIKTKWGEDWVAVAADWRQASDQIAGTNGRQVADFRHDGMAALRYALEREAQAEGMDLDDQYTQDAIAAAMATAVEVEGNLVSY